MKYFRPKAPKKGAYYLSDDDTLYKVKYISSATDTVILQDVKTKQEYEVRYGLFRFGFRRAVDLPQAMTLLNRASRGAYVHIKRGTFDDINAYCLRLGHKKKYFFTYENMIDLYDLYASFHFGKPRKDGRITNNSLPDKGTFLITIREVFQ
jgi:hypothetical protein